MSTDFTWGQGQPQNQKVVAMTLADAQNLVNATVSGVTKAVVERQAVDALEAYKQNVALGAEVTRLQGVVANRDTEIAGLREHIARLTQFVSSMQAAPQPQYSVPAAQQYNNPSYGMLQQTPMSQHSGFSVVEVPSSNGYEGA